jgi:predicted MFS family arabinose efflux permease
MVLMKHISESTPPSDRRQSTEAGEEPGGRYFPFVWVLSLAELVSWGTLYYTFAVVSGPMERDLGWDKVTINGAWSIGLLLTGLVALPVGAMLDRLGGRIIMTVGTLLGAASLVLWSGAAHVVTLYVACAGLGLAMSASLYEAGFAVLMRRFPVTYGDQITRMTLVGGLAPTVFVPLTAWLVGWLGWRAALGVLAGITISICLPAHALLLRERRRSDRPAPIGCKTYGRISNAALKRALRSPAFWALLVTFAIHSTLVSAILFHIIPLLSERGFSDEAVTAAYALIGPAQVGGRIGMIALRRHLNSATIGLLTVFALPIALAMLIALPSTNLTVFAVLIMYGIGNGLVTIVRGTSVPDLLGQDGYGAINGVITLVARTGAAAAPFAVAVAWRAFGGYDPIVWLLFGMAMAATLSYAIALYASRGSGYHLAHS